jgi:2-hydroxycyclohexanecarboxyl-CoA dehydrogenase
MTGRRMDGRVALITGGAGGIGRATAALFCAEGAKVALVDQQASDLDAAAAAIRAEVSGAAVETVVADVSRADAAAQAVQRTVATFGRLDVLVSNAAVRNLDPIADAKPEEWARLLQVNLTGAVNFCKAAIPALRQSGRGSIVVVSSCYATRGRKGFGAYDASKAALLSLVRTLANEEAAHGIRANAVLPGGTLTPYTVGRAKLRGKTEDQLRSEPKSDSLFGRWAEPQEIAYPILWLASDEASYVTGTALPVDGGCTAM